MRIAHVSTQMSWGGGEKQVVYLLEELHRKGVEQTLFCRQGSALAARVKSKPWESVALPPSLFYCFGLGKQVRTGSFDLIHTHDSRGLTFALLSVMGVKVSIVNTCRMIKKPGFFSAIKFDHRAISKHICISSAVLGSLRPLVKNQDKLIQIPSGVETNPSPRDLSGLRKTFDLPEDAFLIVSVGALTSQKRPDFFLEIARRLLAWERQRGTKRQLFFLLVGEGPMRGQLQALIQRFGLSKVMRLTGFTEQASSLIKIADLLVSTAVEEALGNVIMEAFVARTPVVAARSGGVSDLVEHGISGLLADPLQLDTFVAYCQQMIESSELAHTFCVNALEKIKKFAIVSVCEDVFALYKSLGSANRLLAPSG